MIPSPEERPLMRVEEAAAALGLGRSAMYDAIRRGDLPSLRLGRRVLIPTAALRALLGLDGAGVKALVGELGAEVVEMRAAAGPR